jgi:hypothetical protein
MMTFDSRVQGIPCTIQVDYFDRVKPNSRADSDWDYTGYEDFEYTICDRRGRPAPWLERKATSEDHDRIYADFQRECNDF